MSNSSLSTDNRKWHVIYTRPKFEKKVAQKLIANDVMVFNPMQTEVRQWHDRKKRIEVPVFPNYVFVKVDNRDMVKVYEASGFVRFISTGGTPDVIPDEHMEALQNILSNDFKVLEELPPRFQAVLIEEGPFKGFEGMVTGYRGEQRLMIKVEAINKYLSIEVPAHYVRSMKVEEVAA